MAEQPLANLGYAPPARWYQKRRFQRWLWVALIVVLSPLVIAGGGLAYWAARNAWITRQNRRDLAACEAYVPKPEQVVFEMKDGVVTRRVAATPWLTWWDSQTWPYPTVFLHRVQDCAPSSFAPQSQLVAVEVHPSLQNTYDGRTILDRPVLCFQPLQVWGASTTRSFCSFTDGSSQVVILPQPGDHIQVFAGQIDLNDGGRFSFDVAYNGHRQSVRGLLKGNLVLMDPAVGEVLRPPGWKYAVFWIPEGATPQHERQTRAVAATTGQPSPTTWAIPAWWVSAPTQVRSGQP